MNRAEKKEFVANLQSNIERAQVVVLTRPEGLSVAEISDLREKMRAAGAHFKVVKNTLARRALAQTRFSLLEKDIKGPIAFSYSPDPVAAAKVVWEFSKKNEKFSVVCGAYGDKPLSQDDVENLASLPSLDELRAKIMAVIMAPAQKLVATINAPATQLAQVISQRSKQS